VTGGDFAAFRAVDPGGLDVAPDGATFTAEVRAWRFHGLILFDAKLSGLVHERSPARVAADGFSHFHLQLNRCGALDFDSGGGLRPLCEGEALLLDMRRPMRSHCNHAHLLTAAIARDLVQSATGGDDLHGHILDAGGTAALRARLAGVALPQTGEGPALLDPAGAMMSLLEMLVEAGHASAGAPRRRRALAARFRVDRYIHANLGRRDLGAAEIAAACGVSRAALYRMTAADSGVTSLIRKRRLAELELRLASGVPAVLLRELAEALGFANENLMSRQFRSSAGVSPGRYGRSMRDRTGSAAAGARWAAWMAELN
jgi:AraC-like DNA-binding protein